MSDVREARCHFKTCDGDGKSPVKFWIMVSPTAEGEAPFQIGKQMFEFGMDLNPETTMEEADRLSELLNKHVKVVYLNDEYPPRS